MTSKLAISTVSLGWHRTYTLKRKLQAASTAGFEGVELVITDLDAHAAQHKLSRLEAASQIGALCSQNGLSIVSLASFDNFEGHPTKRLSQRLDQAREWIALARALGTATIQIPSNDDPDAVGDEGVIVSELRALADLAMALDPEEPVRFAYEALGWGTHVADWEESLRVVQLVGRPNFGLCLDSYHVLGRLWADPRARTGRRPGGDAALRTSLETFVEKCKREEGVRNKIFYVQLSDAERMTPPILPGHEAYSGEKDGVHSWCTYGRLFPLEDDKGAYLPVGRVVEAWLRDSGWGDGNGWGYEEECGPEAWAARGRASWEKLKQRHLD
ncbi:3-dehydroshikimate dehydratase [Cladophialophora carrionii]|uniref:3-dehydroshikimate dehydratase n=1 Tax=Cladophialophora carrionii TaxID=86049 RepID=A0A1C1CVH1_9EURO|nr:3-dehydroshikimate dehydratase [Cladophialophora carrionii]